MLHQDPKDDIIDYIPISAFDMNNVAQKESIFTSNNKYIMNKTDIIFYLTMLATAWNSVEGQVQALVSGNLFAWLKIVFVVVSVLAYALYEKLNGTIPFPPTTSPTTGTM